MVLPVGLCRVKALMKVTFSTPHGNFSINKWNLNLSLFELCRVNKIPHQSVTFYGVRNGELFLIVGLFDKISKFIQEFDEIIIKPDRNIDYANITCQIVQIKKNSSPVSEYTFPSADTNELHHFEFTQLDCQKYVLKKVKDFLSNEVVLLHNLKS